MPAPDLRSEASNHSIRGALIDDVPAIVDLWGAYGGPTRGPADRDATLRLLGHDPDALLVAVDGDLIAGTVIAGYDGWRCHLYRLAVLESHRRSGIATDLVASAIARARHLGAARVDAMVADTNASGVAFWQESGFWLDEDERRWSFVLGASR